MSYDELDYTNQLFLSQAAKIMSYDKNHSTIHLDGEKTMHENNYQHVSFFSVADDILYRGNQYASSSDLRNMRSNGSSVVITENENRGAYASVGKKQVSPFSNNRMSDLRSLRRHF